MTVNTIATFLATLIVAEAAYRLAVRLLHRRRTP
jgi:hypothetical protein